MNEDDGDTRFDYNLRWWVFFLQLTLFLAPFVVVSVFAESESERFRTPFSHFEEVTACSLLFVSSLLIGVVPGIATFCAKDSSRVEQTMKASVNLAVILFIALLVTGGIYLWEWSVA